MRAHLFTAMVFSAITTFAANANADVWATDQFGLGNKVKVLNINGETATVCKPSDPMCTWDVKLKSLVIHPIKKSSSLDAVKRIRLADIGEAKGVSAQEEESAGVAVESSGSSRVSK